MNTFEFRDHTVELCIAGHDFSLICNSDLVDRLQIHHKALVDMANRLSTGDTSGGEAVGLCREILTDSLGDGAFARIFSDREPTLSDCSDVLLFVFGKMEEQFARAGSEVC